MGNKGSEPLSDQVFHRVLTLQQSSRKHARQLIDERNLSPRDFSVLRYLMETSSASVGQIQAFVHKSPSTTSSLIAQLEEKGFLTRTRSELDNRVVMVALTDKGQELAVTTPLRGLPLLRRRLRTRQESRLMEMLSVLDEILQLMDGGEEI
jgi:DNA-binding MarR family transcriptional regulator